MDYAKYIIGRHLSGGGMSAMIFSPQVHHASLAGGFSEIYSAGFVEVTSQPGGPLVPAVRCWGESVALGVRSDPDHDQEVIKRMLCPVHS